MNYKYIPVLFWVAIFILTSFSVNYSIDVWTMEGRLVTHHFEDQTDSLSGPELFELQDEDGLPVWFGRQIFKDVCISGECKMIRLWLFWDGVGNYLRIQVPENEPLTKSDHTKFEPEDYKKLNDILRDTASVLKTLKQEDLIVMPDSIDPYRAYEVDGYTAATQPSLAEVVVKDAVYTCHTLWHTIYGPVQTEIHQILKNRVNEGFLAKMFDSQQTEYISWAIESVEDNPEFHADFYPRILQSIKSESPELANQALRYFQPELLTDSTIQQKFIQLISQTNMSITYEILWKFIEVGQIHQKAIVKLLEMFTSQKLSIGTYNLILRLITPEHVNNSEEIVQILNNLSENENGYVRNLTKRTLDEKKKTISR